MALRQAIKISRLLEKTNAFVTISSQLRNKSESVPLPASKYFESNWDADKNADKSKEITQNQVKLKEIDASNQIPINTIENQEEEIPPIRRKFSKSSTQNALTMSLKPSRLASPFPEPVKTMPSDRISDEEKSRLMQEEVKMEARFRLQQQQELLYQNKTRIQQQQSPVTPQKSTPNLSSIDCPNFNKMRSQTSSNFSKFQQTQMFSQTNPIEVRNEEVQNSEATIEINKINFGATTQVEEKINDNKKLQQNKTSIEKDNIQQCSQSVVKRATKRHKRGRGCRLKQSKYLQKSKNLNMRSERKYSSYSKRYQVIEPAPVSEMEQCDAILERLRSLDPKFRDIKKPIFFPGSQEEKKFIKQVLKLIGEFKAETKRLTAPYPSYSEVKTNSRKNPTGLNDTCINIKPLFKPNSRSFSSTGNFYKKDIDVYDLLTFPEVNEKEPEDCNDDKCQQDFKKRNKRLVSPYPSYSETIYKNTVNNDVLKKIKQQQSPKKCSVKTKPETKTMNVRKYSSTNAESPPSNNKVNEPEKISANIEVKKKKPCDNPFPCIPVCDYEEVARRNKEKKRNRGKKKSPSKDKKCCSNALTDTIDENETVINKIKDWLNTWRPQSDNIKISKCTTINDLEDRETYVIEITETVDDNLVGIEQNKPASSTNTLTISENVTGTTLPIKNVSGKTEQLPAEFSSNENLLIENIPDYMSIDHLAQKKEFDLSLKPKKSDICQSPSRKKKDPQKKKKPSCEDVKKKSTMVYKPIREEVISLPRKFSKARGYTEKEPKGNDLDEDCLIKDQTGSNLEINLKHFDAPLLRDNKFGINRNPYEPYKLKPQFWRKS